MPNMRVVQVSHPGGPFEIVEREILQPGPRKVRVKVKACGLCHTGSIPPSTPLRPTRRTRERIQPCRLATVNEL